MTLEQIAEQEAATAAAKKKAEEDAANGTPPATPPSNPVKEALDKENKKKRPEVERAAHSLKSTAERLKALGGNPAEVLGIPVTPPENLDTGEDDDEPMTKGDFKRIQRESTQQTALQMAEKIENVDERELAKVYLRTRILPSGDPQADLADALALVNNVKNKQVSEELARKGQTPPKRHISGTGNPHTPTAAFEASEEEIAAAKLARVKPEDIEKWITDSREGKPVVFGTAAKKKREAEARR